MTNNFIKSKISTFSIIIFCVLFSQSSWACFLNEAAIDDLDIMCPPEHREGIKPCLELFTPFQCATGAKYFYVCSASILNGGIFPLELICSPATQTPVARATQRESAAKGDPMCGSIVQPETHTVSENVEIVGTPFFLNYTSSRALNRKADRTLVIPVGGPTVEPTLAYVDIEINIAGRTETLKVYKPSAEQIYLYEWDGLDALGQTVTSAAMAEVKRMDHYNPVKKHPFPIASEMLLSNYIVSKNFVGGWSFNVHHRYELSSRTLYYGDGSAEVVAYQNVSGNMRVPNIDGTEFYIFDSSGKHLSTINGLKGTTKYTFGYNVNDSLTTITDAFGNITTVARNISGHPISITSSYGKVTTLQTDGNGFLTSIKNPNNNEYKMTYFSNGLLHTFTNPKGVISTMNYDHLDRLISDVSTSGSSIRLNTSIGVSTEVITAEGISTTYSYDEKYGFYERENSSTVFGDGMAALNFLKHYTGQPALDRAIYQTPTGMGVEETYQDHPRFGSEVRYPKNTKIGNGAIEKSISHSGSVTLNTPGDEFDINEYIEGTTVDGKIWYSAYDGATSKYTFTSPLGVMNYVTIDSQERATRLQDATFHPVDITYDSNGRLEKIEHTSARPLEFTYNADGYVSKVKNALNQETTYGYDLAGRVVSKTLPDSRIIAFSYDDNGNLTGVTPPGKPTHDMSYNAFDLLSGYLTTSATTYTYNNDRQVTQITRPNSDTINLTYSTTRGRLIEITTPAGNYTITQNGSGWDHIQHIQSPDGITTSFDQRGDHLYANNSFGAVYGKVSVAYNSNHQVGIIGVQLEDPYVLTYNDDAQLISVRDETINYSPTHGRMTKATVGNAYEDYTYSNFGELSSITGKYNSTHIYSSTYTRDVLGRISTVAEKYGAGATQNYEYIYDSTGRLTDVKLGGVVVSSYTYDSNNNRLSLTRGLTTTSGTYTSYDQLITYGTKTYTYNSNGELTQSVDSAALPGGVYSYTYDTFGNLKTVTLPSSDVITYLLDGLQRRAGVQLNGVLQKQYVWRGQLMLMAEMDASNNVTAEFYYGTRVNVPDYMRKGTDLYKIMTNHLGSVVAVVDTATGTVAQEIKYDEFGNITNDTNPGFQPFGFAGGLYDNDTKLVHFNAREYDSETGRWLSKDPILFAGGDTNLYGYVMNDPVNWVDRNGLSQEDLDQAVGWLRLNYPDAFNGVNPKFVDSTLPSHANLDGLYLGPVILVDTRNKNQAGLVGIVAHELAHAHQGLVNTWIFGTTPKDHVMIDLFGERFSDIYYNRSKRKLNGGVCK